MRGRQPAQAHGRSPVHARRASAIDRVSIAGVALSRHCWKRSRLSHRRSHRSRSFISNLKGCTEGAEVRQPQSASNRHRTLEKGPRSAWLAELYINDRRAEQASSIVGFVALNDRPRPSACQGQSANRTGETAAVAGSQRVRQGSSNQRMTRTPGASSRAQSGNIGRLMEHRCCRSWVVNAPRYTVLGVLGLGSGSSIPALRPHVLPSLPLSGGLGSPPSTERRAVRSFSELDV